MALISARAAFFAVIKVSRPAVVADVGSCDGADARQMRRTVPSARVVAFEANPRNAAAMLADRSLAGVEIHPVAVSDTPGPMPFYVVAVPDDKPWARGASSLLRRAGRHADELAAARVEVDAVRLDDALAALPGSIALWVDVEGAADRVLGGLTGVWSRIVAIHIETERAPVWEGQADGDGVLRQIEERGFRRVVQREAGPFQCDTVLLRRTVGLRVLWVAVSAALVLRQLAYRAVERIGRRL